MKITERRQVIVEDEATGFRDALYFTAEERAALTEEQVAEMAQARVDAHAARIATPEPVREKTEKDLALELNSLEMQRASLDAAIARAEGELTVARAKTPEGGGRK